MAISNSKSVNVYSVASPSQSPYTLTASMTETATNVANNTSTISVQAKIVAGNTLFQASAGCTLQIWWNDNKRNTETLIAQKVYTQLLSAGATETISGTVTAEHNADGSLKGYAFARTVKNNNNNFSPNTASAVIGWTTLTTIPRESSPTSNGVTISSASNLLFVDTNRKSTAFTHTVKVSLGSYSLTNTNVGVSTTFNIPATWLNAFTNAKSATGTVECITYNGSTQVGTQTINVTFIAGDIAKPTLSNPSMTETALSSYGVSGTQIVRYLSKKTVTITPNLKYGATVKSITLDGVNMSASGSNYTRSLSNLTSKPNGVVTLTDSRGFTATYTFNTTWIAYSYPTITGGELNRSEPTASTGTLKANGYYFNGTVGTTANKVQYRYKRSDESSYTEWKDATNSSGAWNISLAQTGLEYTQSFSADFQIKDALGQTATVVFTLPSTQSALWIGKDTVRVEDFIIEDKFRLGMYDNTDTLYAITGQQMYDGTFNKVITSGSFDNLVASATTVNKCYYIQANNLTNQPEAYTGWLHCYYVSANAQRQIFVTDIGDIWIRQKVSGTWKAWHRYTKYIDYTNDSGNINNSSDIELLFQEVVKVLNSTVGTVIGKAKIGTGNYSIIASRGGSDNNGQITFFIENNLIIRYCKSGGTWSRYNYFPSNQYQRGFKQYRLKQNVTFSNNVASVSVNLQTQLGLSGTDTDNIAVVCNAWGATDSIVASVTNGSTTNFTVQLRNLNNASGTRTVQLIYMYCD